MVVVLLAMNRYGLKPGAQLIRPLCRLPVSDHSCLGTFGEPRHGCDWPLRGADFRTADVAEGSAVTVRCPAGQSLA